MLSRATSSFLRKSSSTINANVVNVGRPSSLTGAIGAVRNLNVHEHISMELFNQHGITTPGGAVAFTPEEAKEAYVKMGSREYMNSILKMIEDMNEWMVLVVIIDDTLSTSSSSSVALLLFNQMVIFFIDDDNDI